MRISINTIIIILITFSFSYSQSGWFAQTSGTSENLNNVFFINSNIGWITGDNGLILSTVNGGLTWQSQNSNTTLNLNSIYFENQIKGWAVGGESDNNPICQDLVIVLKTTNGGSTWNSEYSGYGQAFQDISVGGNYVFVSSFGIDYTCMATTGGVMKSNVNNSAWNFLDMQTTGGYKSIFFLNSNTGWAAGFWGTDVPPSVNKILKTTNEGISWQLIFNRPSSNAFFDYPYKNIIFTNEDIGYVINGYTWGGSLSKSTDGGYNWFDLDSLSTSNINSVDFVNPNLGWCVGYSGKIIRTDNGGITWTNQQSNTVNYLSSVNFVDSYIGYSVGMGGIILKTITGGVTGVSNISNVIPSEYFLNQNYPNPFNPTTVIGYRLPVSSYVKLNVYNALGKEVAKLVNERFSAGSYEVEFNASEFSSGIYFYTLEAGSFYRNKTYDTFEVIFF